MSRIDYSHITAGRKPWRRWMQLRRGRAGAARPANVQQNMVVAARRIAPPAHFDAWQRDEARLRLIALCQWLEARLDRPVQILRNVQGARRLVVFESLTYTSDPAARTLSSGTVTGRRYEPQDYAFEVGRPLSKSWWLRTVLRNLGLANPEQPDLFFFGTDDEDLAQWLADSAYRLLLREPRFQAFRGQQLPRLFRIPADLRSIALAARTRPEGPMLHSAAVNLVWRFEQQFRQVAREQPQLLPLLMAMVSQWPLGQGFNGEDPVRLLKDEFMASRITPAGWRYLVRHGSRLFRQAWEVSAGQPALEVAIRYLLALQCAGLPPPPPPSIAKHFLHAFNPHHGDDVYVEEGFHLSIPAQALRAGFREADRLRQIDGLRGFVHEFIGVCGAFEARAVSFDANQTRAGWRWFVRQWRELETEQSIVQAAGDLVWSARIAPFCFDGLTIVPIESAAELALEAVALRNCLDSYLEDCADGTYEIYSLRDSVTGKRCGCAGLQFDEKTPVVFDVKGFANSPPRAHLLRAAQEIARRIALVHFCNFN